MKRRDVAAAAVGAGAVLLAAFAPWLIRPVEGDGAGGE